jgi:hypothetical protein
MLDWIGGTNLTIIRVVPALAIALGLVLAIETVPPAERIGRAFVRPQRHKRF